MQEQSPSVAASEVPTIQPIPETELNAAIENGYKSLVKATQISNAFPIADSYEMYKTYSDFNAVTYKLRKNIVTISNFLLNLELPLVKLKMTDNDTNTDNLLIANDSFVDRINMDIDQYLDGNNAAGDAIPNVAARPAAWNREPIIATLQVDGREASLISAANIRRPQLDFRTQVDNSPAFFIPKISFKPNSITPLELKPCHNLAGEQIGYKNPYEDEIEAFEPPGWALVPLTCTFPKTPEETQLTHVTTPDQLDKLIGHLSTVTEIAVDLEHHKFRSYLGFTCLVQITTNTGGDFIIDALALREHLHLINKIFTDPKIIKVLHGAENDVEWLQKDFGVFLVGLIDTHQMSHLLCHQRHGLKDLLHRYCQLDVDKSYQTADWRVRPLPQPLIDYARSDTHYLLYIWRMMQCELLQKGGPALVLNAFQRSAYIARAPYLKPLNTDDDCVLYLKRSGKRYSSAQEAAFRALWRWRDEHARELDESPGYVLPVHQLTQLAAALPRELHGIRSLLELVPPVLATHIEHVHKIILACRDIPQDAVVTDVPTVIIDLVKADPPHVWLDDRTRPVQTTESMESMESTEPTESTEPMEPEEPIEMDGSRSHWGTPPTSPHNKRSSNFSKLSSKKKKGGRAAGIIFLPPYQLYTLYKTYLQTEAKLHKEVVQRDSGPTFRQPESASLSLQDVTTPSTSRENTRGLFATSRQANPDTAKPEPVAPTEPTVVSGPSTSQRTETKQRRGKTPYSYKKDYKDFRRKN